MRFQHATIVHQVGDQLMVILNESTQATRNQGTTTGRTSTNDALPSVQARVAEAGPRLSD